MQPAFFISRNSSGVVWSPRKLAIQPIFTPRRRISLQISSTRRTVTLTVSSWKNTSRAPYRSWRRTISSTTFSTFRNRTLLLNITGTQRQKVQRNGQPRLAITMKQGSCVRSPTMYWSPGTRSRSGHGKSSRS